MREIRTYGSEGGGAARSPYPYQATVELDSGFRRNDGGTLCSLQCFIGAADVGCHDY